MPRLPNWLSTAAWTATFLLGLQVVNSNSSVYLLIALGLHILAWATFIAGGFRPSYSKPYLFAMCVLGLVGLIQGLLGLMNIQGLLALACVMVFAFFGIHTTPDALGRNILIALRSTIVLALLFEVALGSNVVFASGFEFNPLDHRFTGGFLHPNLIGLLATCLGALSLFGSWKPLDITLAVFVLVLSEYRGGLIALALAAGLKILSERPLNTKKAAVAFGAGVLVLSNFLDSRAGTDDVTTGRTQIWETCIAEALNSPIVGHGPNFIGLNFGLSELSWFRPFHCHNQFLDDLVNYGSIFATLSILTILVAGVWGFRRRQTWGGSMLFAFLICGLFEVPVRLVSPAGYLFGAVLALVAIQNIRPVALRPREPEYKLLKNNRE